jgi:hypothetical protein
MDVKLPDGRILKNVPEGTTKAQIAEKLGLSDAAAPQAAPNVAAAPEKTGVEKALIAAKGLPLSIGKGATFGFLDEIQAGIAALPIAAIKQISPSEAYDKALTIARRDQQDFQKQNPVISGIAEVAGGIGTGLAGAGLVPGLSKAAVNMPLRTAAATGAVSGGLYGFGTGENSGQERLGQAGVGGGVGLLAGPAGAYIAPKGATATRGLAQKAMSLISKKPIQPPAQALPQMLSQIDEAAALPAQATYKTISSDAKAMDKITAAIRQDFPDNYDQVIRAWQESDVPLAQLYGSKVTSLAKGAAQYPSGQKVTEKYFDEAVSGAPARLTKNVPGSVDEFYTTADDLLAAGQARAAPLYDEAFKANNAVVSREIDNILATPAGKKALTDARIIMQNDRALMGLPDKELGDLARELQSMGKMAETPGGVASGLRLRTLDYVKKALDDQYQVAVRSGEKSNARAILDLKKNLVDQLDELDVTGLYKQARAEAGDYLSVDKAMKEGLDFLKPATDAELVKKKIAKMTPKEKEAYKIGVGKSIRSVIEGKSEGANPYNAVIGSPEKKKRLMSIYSPEEYKQLERSLMAENKLFKMRNEVLSGSPSVSKAIAAAQIAEGGADALMALSSGGIKQAGVSGIRSALSKAFDGLSDRTAESVAKIIYETDPAKKIILLQKVAGDKALSATEKKIVKQVYFQAAKVISSKPAGAVAGGITVPIFLDPNRRAMEGRGPYVDLPETP